MKKYRVLEDYFQQAILDKESGAANSDPADSDRDVVMIEHLTGSKRGSAEGSSSSSRGKKPKTMWATIPPVENGKETWDERMSSLLISEWSAAKVARLRDWLSHQKMSEMVTTLDALLDERTVRDQIILAILRGANVPPPVCKDCE